MNALEKVGYEKIETQPYMQIERLYVKGEYSIEFSKFMNEEISICKWQDNYGMVKFTASELLACAEVIKEMEKEE